MLSLNEQANYLSDTSLGVELWWGLHGFLRAADASQAAAGSRLLLLLSAAC